MSQYLKSSAWTLCLSVGVFAGPATAAPPPGTPAEQGRYYAQRWKDADIGYQNSSASIKMTLSDKSGKSSDRFVRMLSQESITDAEGDKVVLTFDAPLNIKNSRVLVHSKVEEPDHVWLYLPALSRVKRVASADRSGSFYGSEFSYEDIGSMEVRNYDYELQRHEACGDLQCAVVKQVPRYPYSGYANMLVWYDTTEFRQIKIEYFDRKGTKFKTLALAQYERFLDKYWRPLRMTMVNHVTGKGTVLETTKAQFRIPLGDETFVPGRLANLAE